MRDLGKTGDDYNKRRHKDISTENNEITTRRDDINNIITEYNKPNNIKKVT